MEAGQAEFGQSGAMGLEEFWRLVVAISHPAVAILHPAVAVSHQEASWFRVVLL